MSFNLRFWTVSIVNEIANVEITDSFVKDNELCFEGVIMNKCAEDITNGWKMYLTSSLDLSSLNLSDATILHNNANSSFILEGVNRNRICLASEVIRLSFAGCTAENDTLPQITARLRRDENLCPKISPPTDRKSIEVTTNLVRDNNSTFRVSLNITLPVTVQDNWAIYLAVSAELSELSAPGVSVSPKQGDVFTLTNLHWQEMFRASDTYTLDIDGYKAFEGFTTPCITAMLAWKDDMEVNP